MTGRITRSASGPWRCPSTAFRRLPAGETSGARLGAVRGQSLDQHRIAFEAPPVNRTTPDVIGFEPDSARAPATREGSRRN